MKQTHKKSILLTSIVFVFAVFWAFISYFFVSWYTSFFNFLQALQTNIANKYWTYTVLCFIFYIWIYVIVSYFVRLVFEDTEKIQKKLSDYSSFLAHELKTPIAVVQSNLEVLEYWYDDEIVQSSKTELKNMTRIIDGLLQYAQSRYIQDTKEINLENFIKKYAQSISSECKVIVHNKQFNKTIQTDEMLFWRAVLNLLQNAYKYTEDKTVEVLIWENTLTFINKIEFTFSEQELENIMKPHYTLTWKSEISHWIWLAMTQEILSWLGYQMKIESYDKKFIVALEFWK